MPEEANERLVKLYLEAKGFLVFTHHKALVAKRTRLEADIVAIRLREENDNLPNRIIGEVKAWEICPKHFRALSDRLQMSPNEPSIRSFKILNNPTYRETFLKSVEERYGKGFEFCIFANIQKKYEGKILEFLREERIWFVSHREVVQAIIKNALKEKYSNDSELQLIRLMNKFGFLREENQPD